MKCSRCGSELILEPTGEQATFVCSFCGLADSLDNDGDILFQDEYDTTFEDVYTADIPEDVYFTGFDDLGFDADFIEDLVEDPFIDHYSGIEPEVGVDYVG